MNPPAPEGWDRREADRERWDRLETRVAVAMNTLEVMRGMFDKMERIMDERIVKIHDHLEELDDAFRGAPGFDGISERVHHLENFKGEIITVFKDGPLKPGLISRVSSLELGEGDKDRKLRREGIWADVLKVILAASIGATLAKGPEILKALHGDSDSQKTKRARNVR